MPPQKTITYLINLQRCPERLAKMKKSLTSLNITFERVEAVDSQNLSQSDYQICKAPNREYPYKLWDGELACFLSHKRCWSKLVNSSYDWALIFEDHCVFSPNSEKYFNSTDWIPEGCEIIQFTYSDNPVFYSEKINLADGNTLLKAKYSSPIGTSAYYISKRAAKLALEYSNEILSPIDNYLFGHWSVFSTKISYWRLCGAVLKRDPALNTTIKDRKQKQRKLYFSRYILKLAFTIRRFFLDKTYQYWC